MQNPKLQFDSTLADSPLRNLRPIICHQDADDFAAALDREDGASGGGLLWVVVIIVLLAVLGYMMLSACANGSPFLWLHSIT